jgi:AcrR family transcriptional regulator
MPPKAKFNREDIIEAAFVISEEKGFSGITARAVAKKLGCSVAPIYVNFATIDELVEAVVRRVFAISEEMLSDQQGENAFENMGRASITFAQRYPVFLRELILQPNPYMASYENIELSMIDALSDDDALRNWNVPQRKRLLLKMRIFQIGMSVMVANGHLPSWFSDQTPDALLTEAGDDFILAQNARIKTKNG